MKITLISTSTFPSDQGIRTISAVLKKAGHQVRIVFMSITILCFSQIHNPKRVLSVKEKLIYK